MFGYETKKAEKIRKYRELFNTDMGKEILHDLCKSCHVYHSVYSNDTNEMIYREGERSVVLRILRTINIDPLELDRIMRGQSNKEDV